MFHQLLAGTMLAVVSLLAAWVWLQSQVPPPATAPSRTAKAAPPAVVPAPPQPAAPAKPVPAAAVAQQEPVLPPPASAPPATVPVPGPAPAKPGLGGEQAPQLSGLPTSAELARQADLLGRAIADGEWDDYRALLRRGLGTALDGTAGKALLARFGELTREPLFRKHFLRHELLGRIPAEQLRRIASNSEGPGLLRWWLDDTRAMEETLLLWSTQDDLPKFIDILLAAWEADPASGKPLAKKYFPLALAFAAVFDRTVNVQGANDSGAPAAIDPLPRYQWFVEHNEKGQLVVSIDRSPATDLVWVVCVPVATSELDWAIHRVNLSRRGWGSAYGMVKYLMERAVEGEDPYDEYTFEEILKKGGVCGDQAYFCANTARANGIPAAIVGGETSAGGHAWVALKAQPEEWDTGVGRVGGAAKGATTDPQTGREVSEQEFWLWNEREYRSRNTVLEVHGHLWLADLLAALGRRADEATAVQHANRVGRRFPIAWQRARDLLAAQASSASPSDPAVVERWKKFVDDLRREFREHPRMTGLADETETTRVFPYAELGWVRRELARGRQRVERDSPEQTDLLAESLKREANLLLQRDPANASTEIARLYDSALREYGSGVTGFKQMARDYFEFARNDPEAAAKAVRDIELAYNRMLETGTKDWFRANTEGEITRMIADFHRQTGNAERANQLEKRVDRRLERAKRGAL